MNEYKLISSQDAAASLGSVLGSDEVYHVDVLEEDCFAEKSYLNLGYVRLPMYGDPETDAGRAMKRGAYELHLPTEANLSTELNKRLALNGATRQNSGGGGQHNNKRMEEASKRGLDRSLRALDAVACVFSRLGMVHPRFDSFAVEEMPLLRATTVVADTSSVHQGGLDFVARYLHPAVRMKIPAIVHMEILNQADAFLKRKRSFQTTAEEKRSAAALFYDHVVSQGGQRALLRLELRDDTEIERTPLLNDHLRNAFISDKEPDSTELNLSVPFRSFCDRLILEAARQHQLHASPGHRVMLLTADQGLARMALAEGIAPLYHQSVKAEHVFGRVLSGTQFHPLTAEVCRTPFPMLLWELATIFGKARISSQDRSKWFEVAAIGSDLSWSPVHSRNDLLWAASSEPALSDRKTRPQASKDSKTATFTASSQTSRPKKRKLKPVSVKLMVGDSPVAKGGQGYYRFNIERVINLLSESYAVGGKLRSSEALSILGTATPGEYRRLLLAGGLGDLNSDSLELTEVGLRLAAAVRTLDFDEMRTGFSSVPSLGMFISSILASPLGVSMQVDLPERCKPAYMAMGEVLRIAAPVGSSGYFPAYSRPALKDFVETAFTRYKTLDTGDGFVSVGAWLEMLIQMDGLHPVRTRELLTEATAASMLNVVTEGSTLDTRHDNRSFAMLRDNRGVPVIEQVRLYRGDFLVPAKSSSSIKIERPAP